MPPEGLARISLMTLLTSLKAQMAVITYPACRRLHRFLVLSTVMPAMKAAHSTIQIRCSAVNISLSPAVCFLSL